MLSLESPAWSALRHAYGPAEDIPSLLRAVATDPATSSPSEGPWFELWSALYHQGNIYAASFAAVPHVVQILADHPTIACFDFFLLPALIEVARQQKSVAVSADLSEAYFQAVARLPVLAGAAAGRPWDANLCRSVLAAVAAAKSQADTAELLIEIEDEDTSEVLEWYLSR